MHLNDEHWKNSFRIADDVSHSSSNNYELLQVTDKERSTTKGEIPIHRVREALITTAFAEVTI